MRDFVGYARARPDVTWPNGAGLAVSVVLNYEEGAEPDHLDVGIPPETRAEIPPPVGHVGRDLAVESAYEYGARVGVWRLLDIFDEMALPVTIFACGRALEHNEEVSRAIVAAGHEVCSHGYRWIAPSRYTREEELASIHQAVASLTELTGTAPVGWYSRYGPSEHTRDLLQEVGGFLYDSDSYADELPYYVEMADGPFLVVPYSLDLNDIKFWTAPGMSGIQDFADHLEATYEVLRRESQDGPRMMSIGLHARIAGRPARAAVIRQFLAKIRHDDGVWFARRQDIARWWTTHVPPQRR